VEDLAALEAERGKVTNEREAVSHKVVQYLLTGAEILEGPNDWAGKHLPIIPVVGDEIFLETKCVRKSLIRGARDGQQLYNYWRSAAAELIALAPKSKWLVTAKQIAQYKPQWDKSNLSPKPYLMFEPDERVSEGKPSRVSPPEPPSAMWQEAALVNDDLKAATGIYDASLGAKGNETSGVAIARRQQEGDVSNYHFSDNLQRSLEHAGRVMLDLIPKIYDSERVIRITGDDDSHTFEPINSTVMGDDGQQILLNDLSQARFDIRVDMARATRRSELKLPLACWITPSPIPKLCR
jgi:Phage P22-like portal protein